MESGVGIWSRIEAGDFETIWITFRLDKMGQTWVREFHDGTAQAPDSVTPMQDSKVLKPFIIIFFLLSHFSQPTFDPLVGFPNGRTPRVMNVTAEEMEAVQLQPGEKGYCADKFIAVCC